MISIASEKGFYRVVVLDRFNLQDFSEFEQCVLTAASHDGRVCLLVDLREMVGYTLDMAVEEVRFARQHRQEIDKIAILTTDQWVTWSAWLSRVVTEADMQVFDDPEEAVNWILESSPEPV